MLKKYGYDYDKIFDGKLIVISGMTRSGTSLMDRMVGSMSDSYCLFEPHFFSMIGQLVFLKQLDVKQGGYVLKNILFEDFFLNLLHSRNVNFKESDLSFIGNYEDISETTKRWTMFKGRSDVIEYLNSNDVCFIIEMPNIQPLFNILNQVFNDIRFIHIVRNGNSILGSNLRKGYFGDNITFKNDQEFLYKNNFPYYIPIVDYGLYKGLNHLDRIAYNFYLLNNYALEYNNNNKNCVFIQLEKLVKAPKIMRWHIEGITHKNSTLTTHKIIRSIEDFQQQSYDDYVSLISNKKVKGLFLDMNKKLEYSNI